MHASRIALVIALACAGGAAMSVAPPATAQVSFGISIGTRPPPPRYEVVPPPRADYIWAPGYWNWSGARYVWVVGGWHHARAGYIYSQPRWVRRGDRWQMQRAHWGRDPHWRGRHDNGRHNGWYKDRGHGGHGEHGNRGHHGDHDHHRSGNDDQD